MENSVSEDDIRHWVEAVGVNIIALEELVRRHTLWKSFKITVRRADAKSIEDPMFWPGGVVVQPFYRPKAEAQAQSWAKHSDSKAPTSPVVPSNDA